MELEGKGLGDKVVTMLTKRTITIMASFNGSKPCTEEEGVIKICKYPTQNTNRKIRKRKKKKTTSQK